MKSRKGTGRPRRARQSLGQYEPEDYAHEESGDFLPGNLNLYEKALTGIDVADKIKPLSMFPIVLTTGLTAAGMEYAMGYGYEKVTGDKWFHYYGPGNVKYSSMFSVPFYGVLHLVAFKITQDYFHYKGYKTLGEVPLSEWLYIGTSFGIGAAIAEWSFGAFVHQVTGHKFYDYDSPLVYTSLLSIPVWGISGIIGTIFTMWLTNWLQEEDEEEDKTNTNEMFEPATPAEPVQGQRTLTLNQNSRDALVMTHYANKSLKGDGSESLVYMSGGPKRRFGGFKIMCSTDGCSHEITRPSIYDEMDKNTAICALCKARNKVDWRKKKKYVW